MAFGSPVVYADFSGGINKQAGPYLLQENQCQDARNVTATPQGSLRKRNGFPEFSNLKNSSAVNQLDGRAHSLAAATIAGQGTFLLAVGKTPSASTDSIVSITTGGVATTRKTGLTQNRRWEFLQAPIETAPTPDEGPIYGINGIDTPQYWTGTGNTGEWTAVNDVGASLSPHPAQACQFMVYHLDRIWASGNTNDPGRIFSSGVDGNGLPSPRNWDPLNHDYVDPADGEQITGLGKAGPYLIVFKNRKTYALTDPVSRSYRTISSSIGCVSNRSFAETAAGTMFLSEDLGVCVTDGSTVSVVSDAIEPFIKELCQAKPNAIKNAAATYRDDSYFLSMPSGQDYNTLTLEYQLTTQSWWIHTCASNQFALLDPSGEPKLYSAHPNSQSIQQAFALNNYADGGTAYESYWEGPFWTWGNPHINKRLNQLRADGLGTWEFQLREAFNVSYSATLDEDIWEPPSVSGSGWGEGSIDFGDSDPLEIFGAAPGVTQKRYATPTRGWGRAWSLRVSDNNSVAPMELFSVAAFTRSRTD